MAQIIIWQIAFSALLVVLSGWQGGASAALSGFLGACVVIVPNIFFALRLIFLSKKGRAVDAISFLMGEAVKIATSILLMFVFVKLYAALHWLAFLLGLIVALKAYLIPILYQALRKRTL